MPDGCPILLPLRVKYPSKERLVAKDLRLELLIGCSSFDGPLKLFTGTAGALARSEYRKVKSSRRVQL